MIFSFWAHSPCLEPPLDICYESVIDIKSLFTCYILSITLTVNSKIWLTSCLDKSADVRNETINYVDIVLIFLYVNDQTSSISIWTVTVRITKNHINIKRENAKPRNYLSPDTSHIPSFYQPNDSHYVKMSIDTGHVIQFRYFCAAECGQFFCWSVKQDNI